MNNVKKSIGWANFTINPVKGLCPMACSYCYARRMYKRFKWNPEIRYDVSWWEQIEHIKKPSKIFIGSTIELFGKWVEWPWLRYIFQKCATYPQHTFIFLTKKPENLARWSSFPPNCWVGVSATDYTMFAFGLEALAGIEAKVRFISLEPMFDRMNIPLLDEVLKNCHIDWIILGQQTPVSKKIEPKIEWIREIVEAADNAKIPVFLKNNLYHPLVDDAPLGCFWDSNGQVRQEFPEEVKA